MNSLCEIDSTGSPSIASARHAIVLLAASVMPAMAIISLVPVLPMLMREFNPIPGSSFLVPMALTIPALCVALFSPVAGWLTDRAGRKKLLVWALVLYGVVGMMPMMLTNLYHILATRIALGVAEAVIMTVATTTIADYFVGKERERWIAAQIAVVSLSAIVLIALGGLLGEVVGSRGPFLLYALALPIALAAGLVLFEPHVVARQASETFPAFPYSRVFPVIAITFGSGLLFYTIVVKLGPILMQTGVTSPGAIGAVGAVANVGVGVGTLIFRKLEAATGPSLLAGGLAVTAIGYAGAGVLDGFWGTAAFVVVASIGGGMLLPNLLTWVLRLLPSSVRGRGTGIWTGTFFLAQFAAPLIVAVLLLELNGLRPVLIFYALIAAIGAVLAGFKARSFRLEILSD